MQILSLAIYRNCQNLFFLEKKSEKKKKIKLSSAQLAKNVVKVKVLFQSADRGIPFQVC